jgi:hypothetical protein
MTSIPFMKAAPAPAPMTERPADVAGTCTAWFPGDAQPVQIGVYQRRNSLGHIVYSHWDGEQWGWNHPSPWAAARDTEHSLAQQLEWRGLTVPPAEGYGPAAHQTENEAC